VQITIVARHRGLRLGSLARRRGGRQAAEGGPGGLDEFPAARVPVDGLLGQDPGEDVVDGRRQVRPQHRGHRGRFLDMSEDDRGVQVLLERHPAGQALIQHAAQEY
jgi:hypothetical protein